MRLRPAGRRLYDRLYLEGPLPFNELSRSEQHGAHEIVGHKLAIFETQKKTLWIRVIAELQED